MDDYEVCSSGGVETPVQTAQKPSSSMYEAPQTEADLMAEQAVSEAEAGTSGHDDSYGTDDDQFSDVGEAPDTEVLFLVGWASLVDCTSYMLLCCLFLVT
jgi:hypothetical protein